MKTTRTSTALKFATLAFGGAGIIFPAMLTRTRVATADTDKSYEIDVSGKKEWVDTNLDVHGRAKLRFTATGGEFHSDGRILVLVLRNTTGKN